MKSLISCLSVLSFSFLKGQEVHSIYTLNKKIIPIIRIKITLRKTALFYTKIKHSKDIQAIGVLMRLRMVYF